jgi:Predicted transcriptional regulator
MNERIKEIRKSLNMNQADFSKRIKVAQSTLAQFETGSRTPKDIHISAICREFGVNQAWLETGEGDPFVYGGSTADKLIDTILADKKETAKTVFKALARMDSNKWDALVDIILSLARDLEEEKSKQK